MNYLCHLAFADALTRCPCDLCSEPDDWEEEEKTDEEERYDCPIHGLQNGPDCPRC